MSEHTALGGPMKKSVGPRSVSKSLFDALIEDTNSAQSRYEFVEWLLRDLPGHTGIYLRNKVLTRFYRDAGANLVIWPGTHIRNPQQLSVGNNVQIGYRNQFQASAGITIGDNVLLAPGVKLWTINHEFKDPELPIRDQGYFCDSITIGSDCWIGSDVFVLPGTTLPSGCVVAAKSVLGRREYKPYSLIMGNPAKSIYARDAFANGSV